MLPKNKFVSESCRHVFSNSIMHAVIERKFNTLPEVSISAKEANSHLTCQAILDGEDMGSWGELAIEYLEFKKKEDELRGQGKFSRENVNPDANSITVVKKDPAEKSTWLFDVSKIVWWHMPALYADYAGMCRHFSDQVQVLTGSQKANAFNSDLLNKTWKSLEFGWQPKYKETADPEDEKYEQYIMVLMNTSDCIQYLKVKANKWNYKDCKTVLKKLKEEKARNEAPCVSQTRVMIQDQIANSMASIEHLLKQENELLSEMDENVRKKRRLAMQNTADHAMLQLGSAALRGFYDRALNCS